MRGSFRHRGRFVVIVLLVAICTARATRLLAGTEQGKVEVTTAGLSQVSPSVHIMEEDDVWNTLMDVKDCGNGADEECSNGRMLTEAHLDYIYTQHRNP